MMSDFFKNKRIASMVSLLAFTCVTPLFADVADMQFAEDVSVETVVNHNPHHKINANAKKNAPQHDKKKKDKMVQLYPANDAISQGVNVFFNFEALYWNVRQNGLVYGIQGTEGTSGSLASGLNGTALSNDSRWHWGSRVGAGCNLPYDRWDIYLSWTHLNGSTTADSTAGSTGLVDYLSQLPMSSVQSKYVTNLNWIDLVLGKSVHLTRHFTLKPYAGFRTQWLHQKQTISRQITATHSLSSTFKDHFVGFGFRAGAEADWKFARRWCFFSDGAVSVIPGNTKLRFETVSSPVSTGTINTSTSQNEKDEVFVADAVLGFRWGKFYSQEKYHMQFQLAWENHFLFNAWGGTSLASANPVGNGNLAFMGLTLSGGFTF